MIQKPKKRRVFVKVNSDFDTTGCMQPRSITWLDGRTFQIDSVRDCRPISESLSRSCYTITTDQHSLPSTRP